MLAEAYYIVLQIDEKGRTMYYTGSGNFDKLLIGGRTVRMYQELADAELIRDQLVAHSSSKFRYKIKRLRFTLEDV